MPCRLRLVDAEPAPLRQSPSKLGRYVEARLGDLDIEYRPNCFFRSEASGQVALEGRESGELAELPSDLSLLFIGKSPMLRLQASSWSMTRHLIAYLPPVIVPATVGPAPMP